ncbi:MAG: Flp pilus assembly protein CpaB, partial [Rhodobacteraceae bacterium]|nr:Flp pilus assembly protein CpaB [Paracoccaceae bacterium]
MRAMFGLVLMLGVALAGFAVFMTRGYISQTETALAQERAFRAQIGPMVEVFVINKPLKFGAPITKDDVRTIFWPQNALPEAAFTDAKVLFPPDTTDTRYVLRDMVAFEPLLKDRVTEPG